LAKFQDNYCTVKKIRGALASQWTSEPLKGEHQYTIPSTAEVPAMFTYIIKVGLNLYSFLAFRYKKTTLKYNNFYNLKKKANRSVKKIKEHEYLRFMLPECFQLSPLYM
jgi:hypothetical protein